eukprot:scaffold39112_cov153-Skeletonema_marinoi.AAC.3
MTTISLRLLQRIIAALQSSSQSRVEQELLIGTHEFWWEGRGEELGEEVRPETLVLDNSYVLTPTPLFTPLSRSEQAIKHEV